MANGRNPWQCGGTNGEGGGTNDDVEPLMARGRDAGTIANTLGQLRVGMKHPIPLFDGQNSVVTRVTV